MAELTHIQSVQAEYIKYTQFKSLKSEADACSEVLKQVQFNMDLPDGSTAAINDSIEQISKVLAAHIFNKGVEVHNHGVHCLTQIKQAVDIDEDNAQDIGRGFDQ